MSLWSFNETVLIAVPSWYSRSWNSSFLNWFPIFCCKAFPKTFIQAEAGILLSFGPGFFHLGQGAAGVHEDWAILDWKWWRIKWEVLSKVKYCCLNVDRINLLKSWKVGFGNGVELVADTNGKKLRPRMIQNHIVPKNSKLRLHLSFYIFKYKWFQTTL